MKSILSLYHSKSIYQHLEIILKNKVYSFLWKDYYTFPPEATFNAHLRSFQYKIISKVLYLNKKLHTFVYQTYNYVLFAKWKKRQYVSYSIFALIYKIFGIKFKLISRIVCIIHS